MPIVDVHQHLWPPGLVEQLQRRRHDAAAGHGGDGLARGDQGVEEADDGLLGRPGGALVYIVCSVLDDEGANQMAAFLKAYPGWSAETLALGAGQPRGAGVRLTPLGDSTDGFFVAKMIRP